MNTLSDKTEYKVLRIIAKMIVKHQEYSDLKRLSAIVIFLMYRQMKMVDTLYDASSPNYKHKKY